MKRRLPIELAAAVALCWLMVGCVHTVDRSPPRPPHTSAPLPERAPVVRTAETIDLIASKLAAELTSSAGTAHGKRIAILSLSDVTAPSSASTISITLDDALRVELFRTGRFHLVADADMQRALKQLVGEDDLRIRKALDAGVRQKLGKLLSADLIVSGRITDSQSDLRITLEMIDIADGRLVGVAQQLLSKRLLGAVTRPVRPEPGYERLGDEMRNRPRYPHPGMLPPPPRRHLRPPRIPVCPGCRGPYRW